MDTQKRRISAFDSIRTEGEYTGLALGFCSQVEGQPVYGGEERCAGRSTQGFVHRPYMGRFVGLFVGSLVMKEDESCGKNSPPLILRNRAVDRSLDVALYYR